MTEVINLTTGQASSNTLMYLLLAGLGIAVLAAYGTGDKIGAWFGSQFGARVRSGIGNLFEWPSFNIPNLFSAEPEPYENPVYDIHGCNTNLTSWCPGLNSCVPFGLTCVTNTPTPYVPPVYPTCDEGFSLVKGVCTRIPGTEPIEPTPYIPGGSDWCTWPNGDPLTVPVGMDCEYAQQTMCERFSSIPGYKGCP